MRALAEFIMRGRAQAGAIAVLGYLLPLLTSVTVALVTLRKGAYEGTLILLLGLIPALLSLLLGEGSSFFVWIILLSLIATYVPALVLRSTISLASAINSLILVAIFIAGLVNVLAPDVIEVLSDSLRGLFADTDKSNNGSLVMTLSAVGTSGMVAYVVAFNGLMSLLAGRWLQAAVYNPEGFGSEFRELRLGVVVSLTCFLGSIALRYQGNEYWWWSNILAIPLFLVAFAVAHCVVKTRNLATPWLVGFYFAAFILTPVVICIGFIDAWFDFRRRLLNKPS